MIKRFIIYGALGWIMEVFWTGLGSLFSGNWQLPGYTYLWMFPIYGIAVFLEPLHEKIRIIPWYFRGVIWAFSIFTIEYITGWSLCLLLGRCPWDYSTSVLNISGLITLEFFPLWFTVGLIFEKVHDTLNKIEI